MSLIHSPEPTAHSKTYSLAIIGGGLAGLSLSIQLARLGHRVILFEKERYPFHKVCGEYIAMESWDFLERLGVPLTELNLPRITRLHVSDPQGQLLKQKLNPGGFGISRYKLDNLLAQLARDAGVTLCEKTIVKSIEPAENDLFKLTTSAGEFYTSVAAGSYGKYANLDLRLKREFIAPETRSSAFSAIKYHIRHDIPADLISLHNFDGGYCGMSQVEEGRSCLCYLVRTDVLKQAGGIQALEETVLKRNPHLNTVLTQAERLYEQPLAISQIHFSPKSAVEAHILMLGDAAGLIPPLCGNGMSMALRASAMLSPLLHDFFKHRISRDQLEQEYTRQWRKAFLTRLRTGNLLQHLFGKPTPVSLALRSLEPLPGVVRQLVNLTHGKPF